MEKDVISVEDVKHIAELSNFSVEGDEEKFSKMLSDTLVYIERLEELDTSKVDPTFQVTGTQNVYQRNDTEAQTLSSEDALSNAAEVIDGLMATKGVFDR